MKELKEIIKKALEHPDKLGEGAKKRKNLNAKNKGENKMARPKSEPKEAIVEDVLETKKEFIEVEMHQPYQILYLREDKVRAFITQLIPRGSSSTELENRYTVDIEGHKMVLREPLLKLLFGYKGENLTKEEVDEYFKSQRG